VQKCTGDIRRLRARSLTDAALRTHQLGAMVGWLRWQLAGDLNAKTMFVGSACTLCNDAAWSVKKQKNLN
jgi:hypothetical protein